jgi:hypothetical protein
MIINLPDYNDEFDKSKENNKYFINNFIQIFTIFYGQEWKFYIYFILCIVLLFFYYIINTLILFNYSPFLIILVEALLPLDSDTIKIILGIDKNNTYIKENRDIFLKRAYYQQIGYAFLFFGALILNEIIILNFCGFNKNTFSYINMRGKLDSNANFEVTPGDDVSDDESLIS